MNKKVLVISTSMRQGGNSDLLADQFLKGARVAGNQVEKISLYGKSINYCQGCLACQQTGKCIIRDDADVIVSKMKNAEVIVFATPVYYYGMSGQMKTLLDRANPLFNTQYEFREVYLLTAACDRNDSAMDGVIHGLKGWLSCFDKADLKGSICAVGVTNKGEIEGKESLNRAFEMGITI